MVQQCLMHPTPSGIRNGDGYDWGAVAADLSRMMALADEKIKENPNKAFRRMFERTGLMMSEG